MIQKFYAKLSEKERKVFHVALGVVVLAMFDMLFLRPVTSKLKTFDNEIYEKTNSIRQDIRFLSYTDKIVAEKEGYSVYETDESMEEDKIIAGFLETVELLASESSINLIKLNPSEVVAKKGHILYFANLECGGKLENMVQFMHKIDMTNNLLKVVKFNITGKKASAEDVVVSLKVAKLIIDPNTIGNYELSGDDLKLAEELEAKAQRQAGKGKPPLTGGGEEGSGAGASGGGGSEAGGKKGTGVSGGSGGGGLGTSGQGGGAGGPSLDSGSSQDFTLSGDEGSGVNQPMQGKDADQWNADAQPKDQVKEKSEKELNKYQESLKEIQGQGRVQVKSFETLVKEFFGWGGKPKKEEVKKSSKEPEVNPEDVPEDYYDEKSIMSGKFGK